MWSPESRRVLCASPAIVMADMSQPSKADQGSDKVSLHWAMVEQKIAGHWVGCVVGVQCKSGNVQL